MVSGTQYATIEFETGGDGTSDKLAGGPYWVRTYWATFREADWGSTDAMIPIPGYTDNFLVFCEGHYFRLKIDNNKDTMLYNGVVTIESGWKPLVDAGFHTVDAGIPDPKDDDKLFFFRGTKCLKYSYSKLRSLRDPSQLAPIGLALSKQDLIPSMLSSKVLTPATAITFSKATKYIRIKWDRGWDSLEYGPSIISKAWPSLKAWV
ncbi:Hemopexin/matrixin [Penicillium chrysogenum]|uniref:Hemopexin/matrixin n=1 Tax=Penicillium chrysogenum TaxID=5076 RepID=UPI0024DF0726|nr:Hemopexin/matrixin [Penicillium chrysogenum]KAJ5238257.1 Hemopexin/matrixin [Penicillium chrysogenum]